MAIAEAAELQVPASATSGRRFRVARQIVRKKVAMGAIVFITLFYFCGLFAPLISPYGPNESPPLSSPEALELRNAGPSSEHWLGTDPVGRDLLTRVFYAARTTVLFTLVVLITGELFLGLGLGLLTGYRGGWVDTAVMRIGEVLSSIPTLILMLAITAAFREQITNFTFNVSDATGLSTDDSRAIVQFSIIVGAAVPFSWIGLSRIIRSQVLATRELAFVEAAEGMGASTWRIVTRHLMPGVMPLFLVGVTAGMAGIALAEVSLSFLGLGITPPASSFGTLIADGANPRTIETHPHLLLSPAIPVVLFFLAWNLLGDALVDVLEPRSSARQ